MRIRQNPYCYDDAPCFARKLDKDGRGRCTILYREYIFGGCPFCKPQKEITNGKRYPYEEPKR